MNSCPETCSPQLTSVSMSALSAAFVSSLGKAHREELRQSRHATAVSRSSSAPGETGRKDDLAGSRTAVAIRAKHCEISASGCVGHNQFPPVTAFSASGTGRAVSPPAPEKPAPAEASKPALTKADTAKPAGPRLEDLDRFFGLPQAKRVWDVGNLTAEQEMELGRQLNEMVLLPRFNQRLKTGALERRLVEAAEPLAGFRLTQGDRLQVHHP